ncbi:MAG: FAD:protein FMN transferase [Novosphingobium sp.]|nr:FAD:protein FMN transferase [Novosphingobium sp.]
MGTGWTLLAVSPPEGVAAGVEAMLDRVVAQMSQWEPASDLSRFNRAAPGQWRALPPEFIAVLDAAQAVSRASGGAFDPALGAFSEAWGFGTAPPPAGLPDPAAIAAPLAAKGAIELDALGLRARRTGQAWLDLSGIAKGFGVDLAADWLLAQGVRHFLIEVGGELRGEGVKPDGEPWWVDIERPPGSTIAPLRAGLHRLSVATSGNYRRWLDAGGTRHGHTLDPRTGRPLATGVRSVTVLHPRCMLADAWATALTVLGPQEGMRIAAEQGLAAHMIADEREWLSPALEEMLD